jgi:hypothetical protein
MLPLAGADGVGVIPPPQEFVNQFRRFLQRVIAGRSECVLKLFNALF